MKNWRTFCSIICCSVFLSYNAQSQCNITPELTGTSVYDQLGNNNDYIVVCTEGASTGALLVLNDIPSNFLSFFNNYTIDWGDSSADFVTTLDDFTNPAATHIYSIGSYVLTFSATGSSCTITHTYDVYVGNTPSVSMGTPGGTEGCSEVTIAFPISNADNNIPTTEYVVTFSDGGAEIKTLINHHRRPSHTHSISQVVVKPLMDLTILMALLSLPRTNVGQAQVSVAPVRISDPPIADFTASAETICNSDLITFDDTSDPGTTANQNGCTSNAKFYWTISPASGWNIASGSMGSNLRTSQ
jgi:hypothetical protein